MKLNKRLKFGYVQENAYLCSVERDKEVRVKP